jgi:hypothetical protein
LRLAMSDISNTLRQRLGARPAPQTHPEADLLAAYLEQSLPAVEREPITVHLAICAECREVVSLSLAPEPELAVERQLNPRRRLWLLGLRGAALAACLTIVTVLAIKAPWIEKQSPANQGSSATVFPAPSTADKAVSSSQPALTNSVESKSEVTASERKFASPAKTIAGSTVATLPSRRAAGASSDLSLSYVNNTRCGVDESNCVNAKVIDNLVATSAAPVVQTAPAPPTAFRASSVTPASPPTNLLDDMKAADSQPGALPPPASTFIRRTSRIPKFVKIIPPIVGGALKASTLGDNGFYALGTKKPMSNSSGLVARNSVTAPEKDAAPGSGLRDSDAFTASARTAPTPTMGYAAESVQPTQWKVADGKLWKSGASDWQDAYPQREGLEFFSVASRGHDVWAGGSHATLLHSRTGGMDWERVKLADGASGSVIQIVVEGLHVVVKTSDQQTWTSQDGGKIWTLQASN